jgi:hypothetical protein
VLPNARQVEHGTRVALIEARGFQKIMNSVQQTQSMGSVSTGNYDEMRASDGAVRAHYQDYASWLSATPPERVQQKLKEADVAFHRVGITFAVYGEETGSERLIPFDIIPRILPADEWQVLESGLKQRVLALNLFLEDIYHKQEILRSGLIARKRCCRTVSTARKCRVSMCRAESTPISQAWISFERRGQTGLRVNSSCSRTTCAFPPAYRTCWKTAR